MKSISTRGTNGRPGSVPPSVFSSVSETIGYRSHLLEITRPFSSTSDGAIGGTTGTNHSLTARLLCQYPLLCRQVLPISHLLVLLSCHRPTRIWKFRRPLMGWRFRLQGKVSGGILCTLRTPRLSSHLRLARRIWRTSRSTEDRGLSRHISLEDL